MYAIRSYYVRVVLELALAADHGLADGGAHILVQGLAQGAGLLGAVQDGDGLAGGGDGLDEEGGVEGSVQADGEDADLLALV